MAKKIVEDVLPPRRSVRNIPLSDSKIVKENLKPRPRRAKSSAEVNLESENTEVEIENVDTHTRPTNNRRRLALWSVGIVAVLVLAYTLSAFFVQATVKVTPKQWPINPNVSLEAMKSGGSLNYSLITVSEEVSREVAASGEENVQEKASGDIIIFNNQSSASQVLVKNTRFETPTGLIFRIQNAITVPGNRVEAGKTIPGSIKVRVFADVAGTKYNIGLSDFTIPGFAGDPRFKTITAKSDPQSPIKGGFVGMLKKAKDSDTQASTLAMEKELRSILIDKVNSQLPANQVFFPSGAIISFESTGSNASSPTAPSSGSATLKINRKGTLTGVLFDRAQISNALIDSFPTDARGIPGKIENLENLTFSFKDKAGENLASNGAIQFTIQGQAELIAKIDSQKIKSSLAHKKRRDFNKILSGEPSIAKAALQTYPGWVRTLPSSPERIKIEIDQ